MSSLIRVMIADDHLIVREGLRMILQGRADFQVVAEAVDGVEAVRLAEETQPNVILMDLRMPGLDGLGAIQQIKGKWPQMAVVILTTYNEDDLMLRGLRAGAQSYLLKDTDRETLFNTLHAAARGETLLRPDIVARVLPTAEASPTPNSRHSSALSQRELEILSIVASGARNKEIAAHLGLTERTVKAHLDSIFNKLGVDSRTAAVALAIQYGILPTDVGSRYTEHDSH
jgi:NarL family two-component system response regulator YdfI